MINFHILKSDIAKFARWVKKYYPKEVLTVMIGDKEGGSFNVRSLTKPIIGSRNTVQYNDEEWEDVVEEIKTRTGERFLGTIHSHPDEKAPARPSVYDINNAAGNEKVYGVVSVWKEEGRLRTDTQFFTGGPGLVVEKV